MTAWGRCFHAAVIAVSAVGAPRAADATGPALLTQYCGACHADGGDEGGVALDTLLASRPKAGAVPDEAIRARWIAVWKNLRAETMPPADELQPSAAERRQLVDFVSRDMLGVVPSRPDPGHVVLRRLNRVEYANTVRDLTGIEDNVRDELPIDDTGYGFDTIGSVLAVSPLLIEKYLAIASRVGGRIGDEAVRAKAGDGKQHYPARLRRLFPHGPPPDAEGERGEHLRRTVERLAARGFRRPVDDETLSRLVAVAESAQALPGGSFEKGIAAAVTTVLASPRFLFRFEEEAVALAPATPGAVFIDEYALASRLSYFLWSTMPDDELFRLAREGSLRRELPHQIDRMIHDRRSDAFVQHFVGQWLKTRDVESLPLDVRTILGLSDRKAGEQIFSRPVRHAMRKETELLFAHVLRQGLPATALLTTRQTFLNEPLARFYGIPGVAGNEMRLVEIPPDTSRGGILTHGSFLVVTSNPTRTSPVKRGLFILENLLGTPPPPAPPNVPAIEDTASVLGKHATMRDVMERHRRDALCASCHARMDPLGLALEQYNAAGQWRTDSAAATIDTAGRLVTGESFADVRELSELIAGKRRLDFYRCLTEKMLTYGIGRGLEYFDGPAVNTIVHQVERDKRLTTIVTGVIASVPFQMRRAVAAATPPAPPHQPAGKATP